MAVCATNPDKKAVKPILSLQNPRHVKSVKQVVDKNAQSLKAGVAELESTLDEKMSVDMIKSFFKKLGFSFRRIHISLKSRQVVLEREARELALKTL